MGDACVNAFYAQARGLRFAFGVSLRHGRDHWRGRVSSVRSGVGGNELRGRLWDDPKGVGPDRPDGWERQHSPWVRWQEAPRQRQRTWRATPGRLERQRLNNIAEQRRSASGLAPWDSICGAQPGVPAMSRRGRRHSTEAGRRVPAKSRDGAVYSSRFHSLHVHVDNQTIRPLDSTLSPRDRSSPWVTTRTTGCARDLGGVK